MTCACVCLCVWRYKTAGNRWPLSVLFNQMIFCLPFAFVSARNGIIIITTIIYIDRLWDVVVPKAESIILSTELFLFWLLLFVSFHSSSMQLCTFCWKSLVSLYALACVCLFLVWGACAQTLWRSDVDTHSQVDENCIFKMFSINIHHQFWHQRELFLCDTNFATFLATSLGHGWHRHTSFIIINSQQQKFIDLLSACLSSIAHSTQASLFSLLSLTHYMRSLRSGWPAFQCR